MANIKNFGIAGVSADVQMGKSGGRIVYDSGNTLFKFTESDGSTLARLQVGEPTQAGDVVTKQYLDGVSQGLDIKESVRAATTAAGTLASDFENGDTLDGVTLATGDRILIKDQADGSENGIYVVAASGAPARASDFDSDADVTAGAFCFVTEGTTNGDNGFVLTTNDDITLDTTSLTFTQFTGVGQINAGDGMTKTGNTLNVVGTTDRIDVSADAVDISANYVGQTSITTLGTISTGTWNGTSIADAYVDNDLTIDGGTVDNSVIGGSTPAAGTFTTLTANTSITGTLATAAQPNITSVGTLTALDVDNININGNDITSTNVNGDINLTPAGTGEVNISKVDIDGGAIDGTVIGGTTAAAGSFTTINSSGTATLNSVNIDGGSIDGTNIGASVEGTGAFTTLSASSSLSADTINEYSSANGVSIDGVKLKDSAVLVDTISEQTLNAGVSIDSALIKDNTFYGNVTVESGETLDVSAGTLTLANDQISGDKIEGGTIGSVTIGTLTANAGSFTGDVDVSGGTLTLANDQISGDKVHGGTISNFASTGIDDNGTGTAITIDASNNVSMSGDLTVTGDLTVSGDSVVINTSTLSVEDPLTVLSSGATGSASVDAGFVVERGDDDNVAWLWDESADQFTFVTTAETGSTAGDVTITDYANVRAGSLVLDDNLTVNGGTVTLGTGTDLDLLDNNAAALTIQEGANQYMSFITTDGGEKITIGKKLEAGSVEIEGSNFDIDGGAIDNTVIGGTTAAAITGTIVTANSYFSGNIRGDVLATDGTSVLDSGTDGTDATFTGDVTGDLTGTASLATQVTVSADAGTNATFYVGIFDGASGSQDAESHSALTYNPSTGTLAATVFSGDGSGLTGVSATDVTITANNTSDETTYITFVDGATGAQGLESDTALTYNPSSGLLSTAAITTTGEVTAASAIVSDLTAGRVVLAGTSGALEDSANFTFNGSTMAITGDVDVTGSLDVDNININGNAITSTDTNGNIDITPDGTGEVNISKVDIDSGAIDGTVIGGATPAAGTFTTLSANGNMTFGDASSDTITFNSADWTLSAGTTVTGTWTDLGTVTTVDINGGTLDGVNIGASSAATGLTVSGATVSITDTGGDGTMDGVIIGGTTAAAGTFTTFTSTGIDDNATSTQVTISDTEVTLAGDLAVTGDATITGSLTVNGSLTNVSTTNTTIEDNVIVLNNGEAGASITNTYAGLTMDRGSSANVHFVYDDGDDRFEFLGGNDAIASATLANVAFGTVESGTWNGSIIGAAYGGTGQDFSGSTGVIQVSGGTFSAGDVALASQVSGTLPVANGGTGVTALSDIVSADNKLTVTDGTATVVGGDVTLTVNEGNLTLSNLGGQVALGSQVSGTLPVANGGTGITSGTAGQFLKFTGSTTIASSYVEDLYASGVKVFSAAGATTSGAGEGLKMTNAAGAVYLRSTNTAASGDVDFYLGAQGSGDVIIEGTGNGVIKGDDGLDLQVRGGDATGAGADAGDLIISGGLGSGTDASGNVYIQGGLGGSANGVVQIRDASGNEILTFNEVASAVNYIELVNSATGDPVEIQSKGDDTDINLLLSPLGAGVVNAPSGYKDRANFGDDSLVTKEYVDGVSSTETYARRASFTADSSNSEFSVGAIGSGTTNYVNKVMVTVGTALSGGSVSGIRLYDGSNYLTALDDCDTSVAGTYVIDLPTDTASAAAASLTAKIVESDGTTAAVPTAGVVTMTVQYIKV